VGLAVKLLQVDRAIGQGQALLTRRERALIHAFSLTTAGACALFLAEMLGAPLSGRAMAIGLSLAAAPLGLGVAAFVAGALKPAGLAQAVREPDARRGQRPVQRAEDLLLQEMAGERQSRRDVARAEARLRREEEARKGQQAILESLTGVTAHGPPRAWTDVDQIVDDAGGGALGEVEAEAQVGEQPRLEAHEDGGPDVGVAEGAEQGFEGQEGPRMWFPLRQGAGGHRSGGGEAAERQGVVEQRRRPLAYRLDLRRPELAFEPGAVAGDDARAGLQVRLDAARAAAGDVGGPAAVAGGEQLDDRARLAEGPGGEHEGVVLEFHRRKLRLRAPEIQPPAPPVPYDAVFEEKLRQLQALAQRYRRDVVGQSTGAAAARSITGRQDGATGSPNTSRRVVSISDAVRIARVG
jgi:hypothetical protein